MFIRLLLVFTIVPLTELYVLIKVGGLIGLPSTMGLILLTGIAGAYLARTQGFDLLRSIQAELAAGRIPAEQLLDGAMVLAGGILLLTPGFCTDLFGFILLAPPSRRLFKRVLKVWLQRLMDQGTISIHRL
ncbi:membrane protein FxsA [Desulfuromonas versatilis]|uniref:Membrane protein FxsA n=1 Tax=Desulfuromonas versatilis TaxID=2802975 RepID=A0ABM8HS75_9BACT|nr:FxsA family protein [Desulfuromonas versatilis]BCR04750.1 membrane protein FxsA [Desulfuromonas versatilis]